MAQCVEVTFLQMPVMGSPAQVLIGGRNAVTSTVVNVQTHPQYPGWVWIDTQSGSRYGGTLASSDRTTFVSSDSTRLIGPQYSQPQYISMTSNSVLPDWIIIAAIILFTPLGIYLMWTRCQWISKAKWALTIVWCVFVWIWLSAVLNPVR